MDGDDAAFAVLGKEMASLWRDPEYADFIIKCGDREWPVHRVIVARRWDYFKKACGGNFKESCEGYITFAEDLPNAVEAVLEWVYTNDYDDQEHQAEGYHRLLMNSYVHSLADKYALPALKRLAQKKFDDEVDTTWRNVPQVFADAIGFLWSGEPDANEKLRESLMQVCVKNAKEMFYEKNWAPKYQAVRDMAKEAPGFGAELATALIEALPEIETMTARARAAEWDYRCICGLRFRMAQGLDNMHCPSCGIYMERDWWLSNHKTVPQKTGQNVPPFSGAW